MAAWMKDELERRMNNWAAAMASGYKAGSVAPGFNLMSSNQVREGNIPPVLYGEAEETAHVLLKLTRPQFNLLQLHFVDRPPVHQRYAFMKLPQRTYYRMVDSTIQEFWKQLNELKRAEKARNQCYTLDVLAKDSMIPAIVV